MSSIRRFSVKIIGILLFLSLLLLPFVMTLQLTLNSPEMIKSSLRKSGAYQSMIQSDILPASNVFSSAALTDPGIQKALKDAIPPSYAQASSEKVIDNLYAYIHGTVASPDFSVDLSAVKTKFADNVATYVTQKFDALPRCKTLTIPSLTIESVLQASCMPIGVTSQQIGDTARGLITSSSLFSSSDTFDTSTLAGTKQVTLKTALATMRQAYPLFAVLVYVLPIASVVFALGFILLSNPKRRGVKGLATILLTTGIINIVAALAGLVFISFIGLDGLFSGTVLAPVTQAVIDNMQAWWLGIGGGYIAVAIIMYIVLGITRSRTQAITL